MLQRPMKEPFLFRLTPEDTNVSSQVGGLDLSKYPCCQIVKVNIENKLKYNRKTYFDSFFLFDFESKTWKLMLWALVFQKDSDFQT